MFKKQTPKVVGASATIQFPHCDQRILHAPGECEYCDRHADWQALRDAWGIAFTGYTENQSAGAGRSPGVMHHG